MANNVRYQNENYATVAKDTDIATVQNLDGSHSQRVVVDSSALPTDAATSANQTSGGQKTQIVDLDGHIVNVQQISAATSGDEYGALTISMLHGKTTGGGGGWVDVKVNPSGALTVESTVTSSALPTGAATSALQTTGNATLASILLNGGDFGLQVARGLIAGFSRINKFGAAPDGVQTTATDIWSRADATPTQQIWLAPTAARIHSIVSTSTNDDGNPVGTGARTIRVYGLQTWSSAESSEDIILNGTGAVNTANSYVIIHRMKVLTMGAAGPNVGTISATAATDGTVTAIIAPGDGQTEMAIYGVPSGYTFYLKRWGASIGKGNTTVSANFKLLVNENPNVQTTGFLRKDDINLVSTGTSGMTRIYDIPPSFPGPCIIKVQAVASTADTDATSGFDAYIVAN